ncbi:MAG: fimbrillin family protein [Bacteroidaceae bacterium]|nr:fimbrillin family protein [Bacteroidaceae bacterium]
MKKHLLYAGLFVAALSSCSKDNDRVSAPEAENANDLQTIELGVSSGQNFTAATRGLGMVGGINNPDGTPVVTNAWDGQDLWVLMRKSGTISNVTDEDLGYSWEGISETLLDNQKLTAPTSGDKGEITCIDGAPYYYFPVVGNFDFYGYHVDDAADETPVVTPGDDYEYVVFEINGTQDLMAAKADFYTDVVNSSATAEQKAEMAGVTEIDGETISYSSYAARRTVQPTLVFNHLLTKLNFYVVNMNKPDDYNEDQIGESGDRDGNTIVPANGAIIKVTGIEISNTATKGQLTVSAAETSEEFAGNINWTAWTEEDAPLAVRNDSDVKTGLGEDATVGPDNDLDGLNPVELRNYNVDYLIGAGLLLQPIGDANYTGTIYFEQALKTTVGEPDPADDVDDGYKTETVEQEVTLNIKASDIENAVEGVTGFAAGYAYNVYIKVYGVQQIEIEAVLTPWINGGDVTTTPEDEVFGPTDITEQKEAALKAILTAPETEADYVALLNWAEKYYVSGEELATLREAYNIDDDNDVDAADWAAFRLQQALSAEATAETRATIASEQKVQGCDALIAYLNNTTITSEDGSKTAEYTPSASCAYTLAPAYFASEPTSVNNALKAVETVKETLNENYAKADALAALAEAMEGQTEVVTKAGCDALLAYLAKYDITSEEEIFTTYAAYQYQDAINIAGINKLMQFITKSYLVTDEATFNSLLPAHYLAGHSYSEETTEPTLPWLCVEFAATVGNKLAIEVEGPNDFSKTISYPDDSETRRLLTLCAEELGVEISAGEWTVTINGFETKITVAE